MENLLITKNNQPQTLFIGNTGRLIFYKRLIVADTDMQNTDTDTYNLTDTNYWF